LTLLGTPCYEWQDNIKMFRAGLDSHKALKLYWFEFRLKYYPWRSFMVFSSLFRTVSSYYPSLTLASSFQVRFRSPFIIHPAVGTACLLSYTGCLRRNGQNFGRVFLMLNYTDITQNTYIQIWTFTEIMAIEKCGLLGCPRTVRHPWRHTRILRMPGNKPPLANIVMQWPWRDNASAAACVNYLET